MGFIFLICPGLLAGTGCIVSVSETPYELLSARAHCPWTTQRLPCLSVHPPSFFPSLTPVSLLAVRPQTCVCPPHSPPRPHPGATHHPDGPEGHEPVTAVTAGPGVPAWVLALLQDKHLPLEAGLLKGDPAGQERDGDGWGGLGGTKATRRAVVSRSPPPPLGRQPQGHWV